MHPRTSFSYLIITQHPLFSIMVVLTCIPTRRVQRSIFIHILTGLLYNNHSYCGEGMASSLDIHFSGDHWCYFSCAGWVTSYSLSLEKCLYPFLIFNYFFIPIMILEFLIYFSQNSLPVVFWSQSFHFNYFLTVKKRLRLMPSYLPSICFISCAFVVL